MNLGTSNAFRELMDIRNLPDIPQGEVEISGQDPFFKTPFRIGETAAAALAARAVAANDLWEFRTGRRQKISMELNTAAASCLGGTDQTRRKNENGEYVGIPATQALVHMVELTQPWKGKGDRWYLPHFNLPHLEKTVLGVLQCEGTPEAVAEAVSKWDVDELDRAITDAHATGSIVYTPEEWLQHPHGKHLASIPVITITKVGESEPEGFAENLTQPLSGIRVLELCRILAGPTCGLGLAEHGAEVLMVTAPQLPQVPPFVRDVSHGKRSAYLDYTIPEQAKRLRELAKNADIFVEGYRPQSMEKHGFGVKELAQLRPGLIYVSVDCYGPGGVYSDRAGWDQCAQAVTGIAYTQGQLEGVGRPKLTPVFCADFLTGYLGAYGAMLALLKRAKEGGSYHVHVSLCQAAMLLQREGLVEGFEKAPGKLTEEEFERYAVFEDGTPYGDIKTLGPVVRMSETNPRWDGPAPELGSAEPVWM